MKKAFRLIIASFVSAMIVIISSCSPDACFEETNAYLKASFCLDLTKKIKAPDSLTLYGLNAGGSRIYDKAAKIQPALLPLNPSSDTSSFAIRINGVTDTIIFVYTTYPHLISKECGYTFFHYLDTILYSRNIIDYIYRSNNSITTKNEENIRIFY
ncbi:MAG TPA: DUF6452 family protein [Bacteroidales bacterium]|jgi:hypothetical protein|nr:DUF6452 family protein [Bacteroidales bacterium]